MRLKTWFERTRPLIDLGLCCLPVVVVLLPLYPRIKKTRVAYPDQSAIGQLIFSHELAFLLGLLVVAGFSLLIRQRLISRSLRLLVVLLTALHIVDAFVLYFFERRVVLHDFVYFMPEWKHVFSFLLYAKAGGALIACLSAWILASGLYIFRLQAGSRTAQQLHLGLLVGLTMAWSAAERPIIPFSKVFPNVFLNQYHDRGYLVQYSTGFRARLKNALPSGKNQASTHSAVARCSSYQENRPNIILLLIESYSSSYSQFFSGIENWTPKIDSLAEHGLSFHNFHANAHDTSPGLSSLLAGELELPIPALSRKKFRNANSIPKRLRNWGYQSIFLTTGNLDFMMKGKQLNRMGFDYKEGHENSFYDQWERSWLQSVPDEALFLRALEYIGEAEGDPDEPYFLVLETISSHTPGPHNIPRAFGYVDRQVELFYQKLAAQGFFNDGILIITSDHRMQASLSSKEQRVLGSAAFSLIPFIVLDGSQVGQRNYQVYSQVNLAHSVEQFVHDSTCASGSKPRFTLVQNDPTSCAFHDRGYPYSAVDVTCSDGYRGQVWLDGDNTRFITEPPAKAELILDRINSARINASSDSQG